MFYKVIQISAASLVYPLLLVGLECQLVEFCHQPEASSLIEEVELLVVFVRVASQLIWWEHVIDVRLVNNDRRL